MRAAPAEQPADRGVDEHARVVRVPLCPARVDALVAGQQPLRPGRARAAAGAPILSLLEIAAIISYACMAPLTALVSWRDQTAQMVILAVVAAVARIVAADPHNKGWL